jgi:hypothetical protein
MPVDLKDYVEVPERIAQFREKHPDGSLQSEVLAYPTESYPFVVVKAYAYREPNDPRPGVGHAAELYPGRTPYTKDSELMNAETSAWGRALVAVLAADTKRGIASANEVQARQDSPPQVAARVQGKARTATTSAETASPGQGTAPAKAPPEDAPLDENPGEPERPRYLRRIHAVGKNLGYDHDALHGILHVQSLDELTDTQLVQYTEMLERKWKREQEERAS